ncbi:MAG: hypothetical protein IT192_06815 [Microbacteriaceae bacterium]|nr:hypothetical protein [Microbacteriaceae bacterium]
MVQIESELAEMWKAKNLGRTPHQNQNSGEVESLYWVAQEGWQIVTNENDAPKVAKTQEVESLSFKDIMQHLVSAGLVNKDVPSSQVVGLQRKGIDYGNEIWGVFDT